MFIGHDDVSSFSLLTLSVVLVPVPGPIQDGTVVLFSHSSDRDMYIFVCSHVFVFCVYVCKSFRVF